MLRLLLLAVALTSATGQLDSRTIMQYLQDENMNTLTAYLTATGLDKLLADPGSTAVTLFAPTDQAWNKLPSNIVFSLSTNTTLLKKVLMDHVVNQVVLSQYVRDQDAKTNLNGGAMVFRVYPNGVRYVG
ncbi:transforming growth factor-beta-induced protein ig-h3-like [Aplysia californica]|uniref:Transforming growth factor-beta-induced protein ig-h3-like n=1 Tax=Aplysia californica TaxID=6500 RepID=A0ABM0K9P5_APLCA|nr:transforming growth factor-beta-induced protein ig-h3-like [Aplysia californica]